MPFKFNEGKETRITKNGIEVVLDEVMITKFVNRTYPVPCISMTCVHGRRVDGVFVPEPAVKADHHEIRDLTAIFDADGLEIIPATTNYTDLVTQRMEIEATTVTLVDSLLQTCSLGFAVTDEEIDKLNSVKNLLTVGPSTYQDVAIKLYRYLETVYDGVFIP